MGGEEEIKRTICIPYVSQTCTNFQNIATFLTSVGFFFFLILRENFKKYVVLNIRIVKPEVYQKTNKVKA